MDMIIEPTIPPAEMKAPEIQGKKFWPRAGAYLVDILTMYGLNYLATYGFSHIIGIFLVLIMPLIGKSFYVVDADTTCLRYILGLIQTIIYFALFEWLFGRTIGKIIFGMRVIGSNGDSCNLKQAFTRSVYRLLDGLFFGVVASSYMKPPVYQRLGDQKASTLVVSSKDVFVKENLPWWKFFLVLAVYICFECIIVTIGLLPYIRFA